MESGELREKIENSLYFCLGRLVKIVLESKFTIKVDKENHVVDIEGLENCCNYNAVLLGVLESYDNVNNRDDPVLSFWGDAKFFDIQGGCFYKLKVSNLKEYEVAK